MRWVLVEATQRILPEVGPRHGRVHGASSCSAGHGHPARTPGWSPAWTVWSSCPTGTVRRPTRSCGRPGVKPSPDARPHRPAARRARAASPACRRCRSSTPTARSCEGAWSAGDCAAVPDLTSDVPGSVVLAERPARGPAGGAAGRQHRAPWSAGRPLERLQAQARRLGGQPRPAQGRGPGLRHQGARAAGVVHAPDVPREPDPDASTARSGSWWTGRWPCSSSARSSSLGELHEPARGVRGGVAADPDHQQGGRPPVATDAPSRVARGESQQAGVRRGTPGRRVTVTVNCTVARRRAPPGWWNGRHGRLKSGCREGVRVRDPPRAPHSQLSHSVPVVACDTRPFTLGVHVCVRLTP